MFARQTFTLRDRALRTLLGITAITVFAGVLSAEEPEGKVPLFIVGSPGPTVVIGDARRCPTNMGPSAQLAADRVEFLLSTKEPTSITLSAERGGQLCGGSFYVVPESGGAYGAQLTPGKFCAAQLFRIDPKAARPLQLVGTDNHPNMDRLICAVQQGGPRSSRFFAGGNASGVPSDSKVEIGTGGVCGKFTRVRSDEPSGVEVTPGVKYSVQLTFRNAYGNAPNLLTHTFCNLNFAFTPVAGLAYFADYGSGSRVCEVRLLRADAAGVLAATHLEREEKSSCSGSH